MAFDNCEQINNMFVMAPEYILPELLYEKFKPSNAWYGVVDEEEFTTGKGTTHTGRRLSRITIPNPADDDWRRISSEICTTNACDFDPKIIQHGSDAYNWSLVERDLRTDWYCLSALQYHPFAEQEMANIQANLMLMNREVQEEFIRHRYIASVNPQNKWLMVGTSGADVCTDQCLTPQRDSWFFEVLPNGEPSAIFIRVGVSVANLNNIAMLNNDMLNYAAYERQYITNDNTWLSETNGRFPLYLDSVIESNRLVSQIDASAGFPVTLGGNSIEGVGTRALVGRLGMIERITPNFMHKIDPYAMKFYPDTAFNADLPTFDIDDQDTWPRLFRVFPYLKEAATIGLRSVFNPIYLNAPFAIPVLFNPEVGAMQRVRPTKGYGAAKPEPIPDMAFEWKNPDWQCNPKRDKGYFWNNWKLAWRPKFTEYGYAFLVRTSPSIRWADVNACDLPTAAYCPAETLVYCCVTSTGYAQCAEDSLGQNRVQSGINQITPTIHS